MSKKKDLFKIGEVIKKFRGDLGMSQKDLAKAIGTAQSAIARIESGEQNVSLGLIKKIEKVMNRKVVEEVDPYSIGSVFEVDGGKKLKKITGLGFSPEVFLGVLAVSLLNKRYTKIKGFVEHRYIRDVVNLLTDLGIEFEVDGEVCVVNPPDKLDFGKLQWDVANLKEGEVLLAGLIARSGVNIRLSSEIDSDWMELFENLGVNIKRNGQVVSLDKKANVDKVVIPKRCSRMTSAALILGSVVGREDGVVIENAKFDEFSKGVLYALEKFGAQIEFLGIDTVRVTGAGDVEIEGVEVWNIGNVRNISLFASALMATDTGVIRIKGCPYGYCGDQLDILARCGLDVKLGKASKVSGAWYDICDIEILAPNKDEFVDVGVFGNVGGMHNGGHEAMMVCALKKGRGKFVSERSVVDLWDGLKKIGLDVDLLTDNVLMMRQSVPSVDGSIYVRGMATGIVVLLMMLSVKGKARIEVSDDVVGYYGDFLNKLAGLGARIKSV